jgi:DNA polymerase III epsilon subunit-like protein
MAVPVILIVAGVAALAGTIGGAATKDKPVQTPKPMRRRTREDYNGTSFRATQSLPQPIQPLNTINTLDTLQPLNTARPLQPIQPLSTNRTVYNYNESPYNYYSDPYQINSLADVIFNKAGKDLVTEEIGIDVIPDSIPLIGRLDDTIITGVDYLKRSYLDPISEGNFKEAGLNALMDTGETLDIVSNPVRGLMIDGPKGFVRGLGAGEEGRTTYNFDVNSGINIPDSVPILGGSDVIDLVLETITDPLNFISFGGKAALSSVGKSAEKELAEQLGKEALENVTEKAVKQTIKNFGVEFVQNIIKKEAPDVFATTMKNLRNLHLTDDVASNILDTITKNIATNNTRNIVLGINKLVNITEGIDSALLKATPVGLAFKGAGAAINWGKAQRNNGLRKLEKYSTTIDIDSKPTTVIKLDVINEPNAVKEIIDDLDSNVSSVTMSRIYKKIDGVPSSERLTSLYQQYHMYDGKTMEEFIDALVDNKHIDPNLSTVLKESKDFKKIYDEVIKPSGDAFQAVYKALEDNDAIIINELKRRVNEAPNKLQATIEANKYWGTHFGDYGDTSTSALKNYKESLTTVIQNLENERTILLATGASIEDRIIREIDFKLTISRKNLDSFNEVLNTLDIDVRDLPNAEAIKFYNENIHNVTEGDAILKQEQAVVVSRKNIYDADLSELKVASDSLEVRYLKAQRKLFGTVGTSGKNTTLYRKFKNLMNAKDLDEAIKISEAMLNSKDKVFYSVANELMEFNDAVKDWNTFTKFLDDPKTMTESNLQNWLYNIDNPRSISDGALSDIEPLNYTSNVEINTLEDVEAYSMIDSSSNAVNKLYDDMVTLHNSFESLDTMNKAVSQLENYIELMKDNNNTSVLVKSKQNKTTARTIKRIEEAVVHDSDLLTGKARKIIQYEKIEKGTVLYNDLIKSVDGIRDVVTTFFKEYNKGPANLDEMLYYLRDLGVDNSYRIRDAIENIMYANAEENTLDAVVSLTELRDLIDGARFVTTDAAVIPEADEFLTSLYDKINVTLNDVISNELLQQSVDLSIAITKINQAVTTIDLMKAYNNDPMVSAFLDDLATGNSTTDIGTLFNILKDIETEPGLLSQDTSKLIKKLISNAKSHKNMEAFINKLMYLRGVPQDVKLATLDWITGAGYQDIDKFIKEISVDGASIDAKLLRDKLEFRINGLTNSGIRTNANLHEYLGLGKVDENLLHDSLNDVQVTGDIYSEMIRRGNVTVTEGETYVVFDIETTGLNARTGQQITQIGAIKYQIHNGVPVEIDRFDNAVKLDPGVTLTESISRLSPDLQIKLQSATKNKNIVYNDFMNFYAPTQIINGVKQRVPLKLVGHNIKEFDIPFLRRSFQQGLLTNAVDDTLELSAKMFNKRLLPDNITTQISKTLSEYINLQRTTSNRLIHLMDSEALNTIYDILRSFDETMVGRFLNSKDMSSRMKGARLQEIIQNTLNRNSFRELSQDGKPFEVGTVHSIKEPEYNSVVTRFREILTDVKERNALMKLQFITSDDLAVNYAGMSYKTNFYSYLNGRNVNGDLVNEYVFRDVSLKTIWRSNNTSGILRIDNLKDIANLDITKVNKIAHGIDRWLEHSPRFHSINAVDKGNLVTLLNTLFSKNDVYKLVDNPGGRTLAELYAVYNYLQRTTTQELNAITVKQIEDIFYEYKVKNIVDQTVFDDAQRRVWSDALTTLHDESTDFMAKEEASKIIASSGKNSDQLDRLYNSEYLMSNGAKDSTTVSDRVNTVLALGRNETREYFSSNVEMAKAITKVKDEITDTVADTIAINETMSILNSDPFELANFMFKEAPIIHIHQTSGKLYTELVQQTIKDASMYNTAGISIIKESDSITLILTDASKLKNTVGSNFRQYEIDLSNVQDDTLKQLLYSHTDSFNRANIIRENKIPFNAHTTAANVVNANDYMSKFDLLSDKIKTNSILNDPEYRRAFLKRRDPILNYMNLGDVASRKAFDGFYTDPFRNTMTMLEQSVKRVDGRNKLIELNFNNDLDINGPIWSDVDDEELLQMFNENQYMSAMILTNDKGKPYVRNYRPTSIKNIKELRRLDAVIATQEYANGISNSINKLTFDSDIAQLYYKYVVGTYKTIYVSNIGLVFRNFNDIITKNLVGGSPLDVPTSMLAFWDALKDFRKYNDIVRQIYEEYGTMTSDYIDDFFIRHTEYNRELFEEVHDYATSNVSAGMATSQQEALASYYTDETKKSTAERIYDTVVYDHNPVTRNIMNINSQIEHAGRLSKLRMDRSIGMDNLQAYDDVLRTHFDYRSKTKAMMKLELLFPFVTFPLYNLQYWIDAVNKSPWIVRNLLHMSRSSLNIEEQKQFYIDNSFKLQNALLNGNVKLGSTLFKTNPSVMDAYNLVTQPVEQMYSRLLAPLKVVELFTEQRDVYGNVIDTDTKMQNYLKNVLAIYQVVERPVQVVTNLTEPLGTDFGYEEGDLSGKFLQVKKGSLDNLADVLPSITSEWKQKYGNKIGETFTPRRSYSKQRIPYVKRYYGSSYNFYNRWKAQSYMRKNAMRNLPPTPESLENTIRNVFFSNNITPLKMNYLEYKKRSALR